MLRQVPQDVAELLTFSRLAAARDAGPAAQGGPLRLLQQLPEEAGDMLMGGWVAVQRSAVGWSTAWLRSPVMCLDTRRPGITASAVTPE